MTPKFKKNDIISCGSSYGIVNEVDDGWYYVSWIGVGDSMLNIAEQDRMGQMKKVFEYEPGSSDDILIYGKMEVYHHG